MIHIEHNALTLKDVKCTVGLMPNRFLTHTFIFLSIFRYI